MKSRHIAFGGCVVRCDSDRSEIFNLLTFLFGDMQVTANADEDPVAHYRIEWMRDSWRLHCNNVFVDKFENINMLGEFLSGDVLFRLIEQNRTHLAIHAGLVSNRAGSILLPAESGSGKTSVTAWLLTHGWQYHTDELVLIHPEGNVVDAFRRPLNVKAGSRNAVSELTGLDETNDNEDRIRQSTGITMMLPSLFNDAVNNVAVETPLPSTPPVRLILFPRYAATEPASLEKLTPAAAGLELMRSNVIARNLSGHGFSEIVSIAKQAPSFRMTYRHFDDLQPMIGQLTDSW